MYKSTLLILTTLAATAWGQMSNLATTGDGGVTYFASERLRLQGVDDGRNTADNPLTRFFLPVVFQVEAGQITAAVKGEAGQQLSSFVQLSLSADGSVRAANWETHCIVFEDCFLDPYHAELTTPDGTTTYKSLLSVSPNGRYVLEHGDREPGPVENSAIGLPARLLDLETGEETQLPASSPGAVGRFVANDGTVLLSGARLVGPDLDVELEPAGHMRSPQLAADASRIVYGTATIVQRESPGEVHILEASSGTDTTVAAGYLPSADTNAQVVSYIAYNAETATGNPDEVWVADAVSGLTRKIGTVEEGIVDQVISGDGLTVFAATATGRLLAIPVQTGVVSEVVAATGPNVNIMRAGAPGSYDELLGAILPDPESFHIFTGDLEAPWIGQGLFGLAFQVAWEADPAGTPVIVLRGPEERLEQVIPADVLELAGFILPIARDSDRGPYYFAVHEDWSRPVRYDDPAKPGEILHAYGMGFGPVDGTLATGQPTPTGRLYRLTATCQWHASGTVARADQLEKRPIEMFFAGLAPGATGVYQFDFRVPEDWDSTLFMLGCDGLYQADIATNIPVAP